MKTSILFYCAFLIVAVSSVLFGLDWQPVTLSAMPEVDVVAYAAPPPAPKVVIPNVALSPVSLANPVAPNSLAPRPVTRAPAGRAATNNPSAPVAETPPPKCDVSACAAAYRSFRESDCTYNPSFGPRQLCTKGVVPSAAAATPDAQSPSIVNPEPGAQPNAQSNTKCNVSACAAAFGSFTASDCTYQPSVGPRKICAK
jgi:hypothetical protein